MMLTCLFVQVKEEPVYDLLEIPDDQLTAEQIATKKRQKILKSAREGRARAKALQKAKREKVNLLKA